jgi:hypothetical protein
LTAHDPKRKTSFVFEFQMLADHGLVRQLLARQILVHNALFDLQILLAAGFEPADVVDTTQLAAIALPPDSNSYGGEGEPQLIRLKYALWSVAGRPRRACWMPDTEEFPAERAVVHLLL